MGSYIQITCQSFITTHILSHFMKEYNLPHDNREDLCLKLISLCQDVKSIKDAIDMDSSHKMMNKIELIEDEIDLLLALLDDTPDIPPTTEQADKAPTRP